LRGGIEQTLLFIGLGSARTIPIALSIPVFGGPTLPRQIRIALGIGLSAFAFPSLGLEQVDGDAVMLLVLAAREIIVGLVIGFICSCIFRAAEMAGLVMDILRGANQMFSSPTGIGRSPLSALMALMTAVVFLEIRGPAQVAEAISHSYSAIPIASPEIVDGGMLAIVIIASVKLLESAIGLCAPAIVSLVLADLALGVVGRFAPLFPGHSFGISLKALMSIGIILLALAGFDYFVQASFQGYLRLIRESHG
jgi:flagellar biosynthesis protein FliR